MWNRCATATRSISAASSGTIGFMKREKYLFIGTPDMNLNENRTVIEAASGKYIVKRCERYFVQDNPIYTWAIMVPYGERREDDYDADS